ncbi:hypothetical protein Bca4012_083261 [Brassica carinata]
MVEPNPTGKNSRLLHFNPKDKLFILLFLDFVFTFGSCKEGWHYYFLSLNP